MDSCIIILGTDSDGTQLRIAVPVNTNIERRMDHPPNLSSIYFRVALMLSAAASSAPKHARTTGSLQSWPFHLIMIH